MIFDRTRLQMRSLSERAHDLDMQAIKPLQDVGFYHQSLCDVAQRIITARKNGKAVIMIMGGHVIRSGVQNYLIDLLERGYISCLAMNGSVMIHDYEFALIGATTESVAKYIHEGQFGLWK